MKQGVTLIILSIVAIPSLLLYRRSGGLKILNKIIHLQGWLGLLVCFWGIFSLFTYGILKMPQIPHAQLSLLLKIIVSVFQILLGYLLGYSLISKYVYSGNKQSKQKGNELLLKLAPVQGKVAVAAFTAGVLHVLWVFIIETI